MQGTAHDFPAHIGKFVQRTNRVLGSEREIIFGHTLLPYYLRYRPKSEIDAVLGHSIAGGIGSLKIKLGVTAGRFQADHPLKACPTCMSTDIERHHCAYWHLPHQLPGVWLCHIHEIPLLACTEKTTGVNRFGFLLPKLAVLRESLGPIDAGARAKLAQLGRITIGFVGNGASTPLSQEVMLRAYWTRLSQQGFAAGKTRLDLASIGSAYLEDVTLLQRLAPFDSLPRCESEAANQVARLLRGARGQPHPMRHLLLIGWLFSDWPSFLEAYALACNTPAEHAPAVPVSQRKEHPRSSTRGEELRELIEDGFSVRAAAAQLKIDQTTAMARLVKLGIQVPVRPKTISGAIRQGLVRGIRDGLEKSDLAERYDISISAVTRIMRTEVGLQAAWHEKRYDTRQANCRHAWMQALQEFRIASVKRARMLIPAEYAWLYRNDRSWLQNSVAETPVAREKRRSTVDWQLRDDELHDLVAKAMLAASVKQGGGIPRLVAICQELPQLRAKLSQLDKLPRTEKLLATKIKENR